MSIIESRLNVQSAEFASNREWMLKLVEVGQRVSKGDALLKLEAMKIKHTIRTAGDGVIEAIYYGAGEMVAADTLLVQLKEVDA